MPLLVNKNGTWTKVKPYLKVNDTWRLVTNIYVNINDTWRPLWSYRWEVGN